MYKRICLFALIFCIVFSFCNTYKFNDIVKANVKELRISDKQKEYIREVYQENIVIPALTKSYRFLYLSDVHVIIKSRVEIGCFGNTDARMDGFKNNKGKSSYEQFPYWVQYANYNVDALLMGGDIIDYLSDENVNYIKDNLKKLKIPYLYTMGNHDSYVPWDDIGFIGDDKNLLGLFRKGNTEVQIQDYGDFNVVSVNDYAEAGLAKISKKALKEFKKVYNTDKPMILIVHVPLCTENTDALKEQTVKTWGSPLLFGENCGYDLDDTTKEFLDMVVSDNSPVVAVLSGHLHFYHKDMLNDKIVQIVSDYSAHGYGTVITVSGDNVK